MLWCRHGKRKDQVQYISNLFYNIHIKVINNDNFKWSVTFSLSSSFKDIKWKITVHRYRDENKSLAKYLTHTAKAMHPEWNMYITECTAHTPQSSLMMLVLLVLGGNLCLMYVSHSQWHRMYPTSIPYMLVSAVNQWTRNLHSAIESAMTYIICNENNHIISNSLFITANFMVPH
jgi:hypothetical protein